jgi:hypothetical protein
MENHRMTNRMFGAFAPLTPPISAAEEAANRRIARGAWLIARLVRQEPVRYQQFRERFGRPGRSFCCEVAALRAAGIYRGSELLGSPNGKPRRGGALR